MKCFQEKYIGIISRYKALYYVCKIAGLVPFSFIVNSEDGFETINTNMFSNVLSVAWSVLMFCALLVGTVIYCLLVVSNRSTTTHNITAYMVSFPMTMLMALLAILLNLTANQRKFSQLLRKLNCIDIFLFKYDRSGTNKWFKFEMGLILFILIPWLCFDGWLWRHRMGLIGEVTLRVSHFIQFLVIVQFCKLTQFLRHSLKTLNEALCACVYEGRGRLYVTGKQFLNKSTKMSSIDVKPTMDSLPAPMRLADIEDISENKLIPEKRLKVCNFLEIRRMYGQIYDAAEYLNSIYGLSVLLEFVRNILSVIGNMLPIIVHLKTPNVENGQYQFSVICRIAFFIFREVAIIVSCHMAMSEAHKLQDNVQRALLRQHISTDALEQLKLFSVQLMVNGIKFTAFGFFTLNLATLSTFIASVITYIIVLVQLN